MTKKSEDLLNAPTAKFKDLADKNTETEKLTLGYKSIQTSLMVTMEKFHEYNKNNNELSSRREAELERHRREITNRKTGLKMKSIKLLKESKKSRKLSI